MNDKRKPLAVMGTALAILAGGMFWAAPAKAADDQTVREKALASGDELASKLTLFFRDAVTAKGIPEAKVSFQGADAVTDEKGRVSFALPDLPDDSDSTLYATVQKKGYVTSQVPLLFRLGTLFDYHYSISPTLPPGNLRVVLDWGQDPPDLDAHLVKVGAYHISYRDMKKVEDQAKLDHDAQNGYGPETITIMQLDPHASYVFFVHDFTHRGDKTSTALGQSHAHVSVFSDTQLLRTFEVPKGAGNHWSVFFFQNGQIVPASALGEKPLEAPPAAKSEPGADQ
jgi:hypothetical protein